MAPPHIVNEYCGMPGRKSVVIEAGQLEIRADDDHEVPTIERMELLESVVASIGRTLLMHDIQLEPIALEFVRRRSQ